LVMDENRNFETRDEVIEQVESMVKRDRNHPSVIMQTSQELKHIFHQIYKHSTK